MTNDSSMPINENKTASRSLQRTATSLPATKSAPQFEPDYRTKTRQQQNA
jgi:hypothetical protein